MYPSLAALFTVAKTGKQTKCLTDERIKKMWYIFIQWNITQSLKKNEIMPLAATWMDLETVTLSEISQTGKDEYHMISLI